MRGLVVLVTALVMAAAGCAAPGLKISRLDRPVPTESIVDLESGRLLEPAELISRLAGMKVVYLGEYHDHPVIHERQVVLLRGLAHRGLDVAVGLEMFPRTRQGVLDDWLSGKTDEAEFIRLSAGDILSPEILSVYMPLLRWARENDAPLLALNAPREVTAAVARSGLEALTGFDPEAAAEDIVLGPPEYKERVTRALSRHSAQLDPDHFFAAQVVWDETMAETIAEYFEAAQDSGLVMAVICGNEHIFGGYGVPERVSRRIDLPAASVLMPVVTDAEVLGPAAADYAWPADPAPETARPRLGVRLESVDEVLRVAEVEPGSEAERIGLRPGDVLLKLNGISLSSPMDFHRAAVGGSRDKTHLLTVDRDGMLFDVKFRFRSK